MYLFYFTVVWYRKPCGKEIAVLNGYTYFCDRRTKTTETYVCTAVPIFGSTRSGNPVLILADHRYNLDLRSLIFSTTRAGNPVLIAGDYRYNHSYGQRGPKKRWTCTKRRSGCRVIVFTVDQQIISQIREHNH
ncbi:hypothetical protein B5X24_HaOG203944 [Helicoverpa armigera]|uniref:FLYWCH-type domain-containing protein n=1 Tax=Helicoverpa armigera TaxID=29058 RepID=A0A2W1BYY0_HELAM|nr:hypothetical protein B5X24_HaOG203944 [Helicoverpa armigera]